MNDRWFAIGAFADSPLERHADILFDRAAIDRQRILETDVFYLSVEDDALCDLPSHLLILHEPLAADRIAALLEPFPGRDLLSRTGHDIVNLFAPLADYQYLSAQTITRRIERGSRFGQQFNLMGHLLQHDIPPTEPMTVDEFLYHFSLLAAQAKFSPPIERRGAGSFPLLSERLATGLIREILFNWRMHGQGEERVIIDTATRTLTFSNKTAYTFPFKRHKAVLRRPYQKFGNTDGNGLGLFLIALIAHTGGFSWDIALNGSSFSLSFSFGA
ncbi:MAG TPA: hypothetical protein PLV42_09840 [bacterium]|nr:hypothetical protein [bacterium]